MATEKVQDEKMTYRCRVHAEELLPLLCKDCDSPVCVDCVTTSHAGHKLCKISECIEDKINQLNDAMEGNGSARFDLKKIEENLQNNKDRFKTQVEEMIQRVTEREDEIVKEVKNVCKQTVEQIKNLATEIENPMKNDEEKLKRLTVCDKFKKENNEEFIKSLYFYNELKFLNDKYVNRVQNDVPFSLELRDLTVENIVDLVGSIFTDEHSSSDEDLENNRIFPILHETNIKGESLPHQYKKKFAKSNFGNIVLNSSEKKFLRCENNIYHLSKQKVHKLVEGVASFTYVPETDEIIYVLTKQASKIFRRSVSEDAHEMLYSKLNGETALCIDHSAEHYMIIFSETIQTSSIKTSTPFSTYTAKVRVRFMDEMGCVTKPMLTTLQKDRNIVDWSDPIIYKTCQSSFVQIRQDEQTVIVNKGYTFDTLFTYCGSRGCKPSLTFSPSDACEDSVGNFLVIDCYDNTVHLLDSQGTFLRIIMSAEDGLSRIKCIVMDTFGWLWMGCGDGFIHFANYQHFKSTTRRDRYLERQKNKKNASKD